MNAAHTNQIIGLCGGFQFFFVGGIVRDFVNILLNKSSLSHFSKNSLSSFNNPNSLQFPQEIPIAFSHIHSSSFLPVDPQLFGLQSKKIQPEIVPQCYKGQNFDCKTPIKQITPCIYLLNMQGFVEFLHGKDDIDISTILTPKEAGALLDILFTGRKRNFGTNVIEFDKWADASSSTPLKVEITSTRIDEECDGRNAKMKFGASIFRDSLRRDFTFNAMYLRSDGLLFDFHAGMSHLQNKEIHFIGNARQRIKEDFTRIKRYHNFCERFGIKNPQIESDIEYILGNTTKPIVMR